MKDVVITDTRDLWAHVVRAMEEEPPKRAVDLTQVTWLTVGQASEYAQLCEKTIRRGYEVGGLRASGRGTGAVRIHRDDLDEWLKDRR